MEYSIDVSRPRLSKGRCEKKKKMICHSIMLKRLGSRVKLEHIIADDQTFHGRWGHILLPGPNLTNQTARGAQHTVNKPMLVRSGTVNALAHCSFCQAASAVTCSYEFGSQFHR